MKTIFSILIFLLVTLPIPAPAQDLASLLSPDHDRMITAIGECDNYIWIGTNHGVYKINKRNGKRYHYTKKKSQLPDDYITSIACAPDGQTYIGTFKGILMWNNSGFVVINTENSNIPSNYITALAIDRENNLWIGTYGDGLVKSTGDPIKPFRMQPVEYNNEKIYAISFDQSNNVWVTFYDGKLACLRQDQWHTYSSIKSVEKLQPELAGRFLLNTPDQGNYLCNGSLIKNYVIDSCFSERTCSYFSIKYSRFIICYKDGVDVVDWNDSFHSYEKLSVSKFIEYMYLLNDRILNKKKPFTWVHIPGDPNFLTPNRNMRAEQ